jgi:hypothetical protein
MVEATSPESSQEDVRKKLAEIMESKQYVEEPEILPWYKKDVDELKPRTRDLFENYSHVPSAEVESHLRNIVSTTALFPLSQSNTSTARRSFQGVPLSLRRQLGLP